MFSFLAQFIGFAISAVEDHPDIAKTLLASIASVVQAHLGHPSGPSSPEAQAGLQSGLAAAASSAVTSVIAKMFPAAVARA